MEKAAMMKKNEKLPEVEAFEQAFDRSAQRVSSPLSRSQIQQASLGRATGAGPKLGVSGALAASSWTPPGQPLRRGTGPKRAQRWNTDDEEYLNEEEDEWEERAARKRAAPPPAERSRGSGVLRS